MSSEGPGGGCAYAWVAASVALLDAIASAPFVHSGPVEGDTIRYALDLERWRAGEKVLGALFNADVCFAYYAIARALAACLRIEDAGLPTLLNALSCAAGVCATGLLALTIARTFGARTALAFGVLWIAAPAWWVLHLYGNPNVVGLAFASGALALRPSRPGARAVAAGLLGGIALCVRTDVGMLLPAAFALGALSPVRIRLAAAAAAVSVGTALVVLILGAQIAGTPLPLLANVGRHVDANLNLGTPHWFVRNCAFLISGLPPLVGVAALLAVLLGRGETMTRARRTASIWIAPAAIFLVFGRVPLTRILAPLLPGALLPLAAWMGDTGRFWRFPRSAWLVALIAAAHATAAVTPFAVESIQGRSLAARRAGHFYFLGWIGDERARVARHAEELAADARTLMRSTPSEGPTAIVGEDGIFYLWALASANPRTETRLLGTAYATRLDQVTDAESGRVWYLLSTRPGADPVATIAALGAPSAAEIHWTLTERRVRGIEG